MSPQFPTKVYTHLLLLLFSAWLANCSGVGGSSEVTNTGIQCAQSERAALLQFKQGIQVDHCGLLHSWGDGLDCCQWRGIHCNNRSGHVIGLHLPGIFDSNNNYDGCLEDELPGCWGYFENLWALNLQNNKLWGRLPNSIGKLHGLHTFHLSNNNISGELPLSLKNCTSLTLLDLSHNSLTGYIPSTLWDSFGRLVILTLQSNKFIGTLPSSICQLSQIQIFDLSSNHISGTIPRCIYNLRGMADTTWGNWGVFGYASIMWKREDQLFIGDLHTEVRAIDFSNNKLEGRIPDGISSLVGLRSINLSRNHLSGAIPSKIGQLTSLESLDLSYNHLSGEIPTSLVEISALGVLDFSYNNLSGKIPTGTQLQGFNDSTYMGNPGLCGPPLPKCKGDEAATIPQSEDNATSHNKHHIDDFMLGMYISVVLGVITGFWGVCGTLVLKRSWRHAFFRFYDEVKDKIYMFVVVYIARLWRRS